MVAAEQREARDAITRGEARHTDHFSPIAARRHRYDFKLQLTPRVAQALGAIASALHPALEQVLGANPAVFEMAMIVAEAGAPPQPIHADIVPAEWVQASNHTGDEHARSDHALDARATHARDRMDHGLASPTPSASVYVALQDILEQSMGPTLFLPRTHIPSAHAALLGGYFGAQEEAGLPPVPEAKRALLTSTPKRFGVMEAGDVILFDQRLLHAGTAHTAAERRALLCLSFMRREELQGPQGSLRSEYAGLTLRDLASGAGLEQDAVEATDRV